VFLTDQDVRMFTIARNEDADNKRGKVNSEGVEANLWAGRHSEKRAKRRRRPALPPPERPFYMEYVASHTVAVLPPSARSV
jgi:hypothetical protein